MANHGTGNGQSEEESCGRFYSYCRSDVLASAMQFAELSMDDSIRRTTGYVSYGIKRHMPYRPNLGVGNFGTYWLEDNQIFMADWIPDFVQQWMSKLRSAYDSFRTTGRSRLFDQKLQEFFKASRDPYWTTLELVATGPHVDFATKCLAGFQEYVAASSAPSTDLSNEVMRFGFLIGFGQKDLTIKVIIIKVYKLLTKPTLFVPLIVFDIAAKRYDVAASSVHFFGLQNYFEFDEILFPLLMQNRIKEIDQYLDGKQDLRNRFVLYLDALCDEDSDIAGLVQSLDIPDVQKNRLTTKAMIKVVHRLVNLHNVPKQFFPTVRRTTKTGAILFILNQFYTKGTMHEDDVVDYIYEIVDCDPKLQEFLVKGMMVCDIQGSAWFARKLKMPRGELPMQVRMILDSGKDARPSRPEISLPTPSGAPRRWHDPIPYAAWKSGEQSCGLPEYAPIFPAVVHYITDTVQFVNEVEKIRKNTNIMAIDCEWKPTFDASSPRLALIQMATDEGALIVDILEIGPKMTNQDWAGFIKLFSDPYMLKLGFGFVQDYIALAGAHPALVDIASITTNLLQVDEVCRSISKEQPDLYPYYVDQGLKKWRLDVIAELCLGVTMDKGEQFSKWDRRPLRESQKDYAVADAHVLLDIFRVLQMRCRDKEIYDIRHFLKTSAAETGSGDQN